MRKLEFTEPNFICKVEDSEGKIYDDWLFRFETKDELVSYLEERTYKLLSGDDYKFKTWLDKAETASKLANDAKNAKGFEYDNKVWTDLKQYLFTISHGKCGYCEQKVTGVYAGDVEHYRPKKKVSEDANHPGYYWLAYDPTNYVPVCQNCNGARAKANHFPLEPGSPRAYLPTDDVTQERPLLINPMGKEDPSKHLEFVGPEGGKEDFGKIRGISEAGKQSREVYHLNRGPLIVARREAYKILTDNKKLLEADWKTVTKDWMSQWKMGVREFTLVIKAVLTAWYTEIEEKEKKNAAEAIQNEAEKIKAAEEQIKQERLRLKLMEDEIDNNLLMLRG